MALSKNKKRFVLGLTSLLTGTTIFGCSYNGPKSINYWKHDFANNLPKEQKIVVQQALENSDIYKSNEVVSGDTTTYAAVFQDDKECNHGKVEFKKVGKNITGQAEIDRQGYEFSSQENGSLKITPTQ